MILGTRSDTLLTHINLCHIVLRESVYEAKQIV